MAIETVGRDVVVGDRPRRQRRTRPCPALEAFARGAGGGRLLESGPVAADTPGDGQIDGLGKRREGLVACATDTAKPAIGPRDVP